MIPKWFAGNLLNFPLGMDRCFGVPYLWKTRTQEDVGYRKRMDSTMRLVTVNKRFFYNNHPVDTIFVYIYIYSYVYVHVYIYIYIYIHLSSVLCWAPLQEIAVEYGGSGCNPRTLPGSAPLGAAVQQRAIEGGHGDYWWVIELGMVTLVQVQNHLASKFIGAIIDSYHHVLSL